MLGIGDKIGWILLYVIANFSSLTWYQSSNNLVAFIMKCMQLRWTLKCLEVRLVRLQVCMVEYSNVSWFN
jgi:hypothetical protein